MFNILRLAKSTTSTISTTSTVPANSTTSITNYEKEVLGIYLKEKVRTIIVNHITYYAEIDLAKITNESNITRVTKKLPFVTQYHLPKSKFWIS